MQRSAVRFGIKSAGTRPQEQKRLANSLPGSSLHNFLPANKKAPFMLKYNTKRMMGLETKKKNEGL